jgi:transposase
MAGYNGGMIETTLPRAPDLWAPVSAPDSALLVAELATLRAENAALRAENLVRQGHIRELEARLGQNSSNSSGPPSSDPPQAPARPKAPPSGRQRGGQPGHPGSYCALLPVEQVDAIVVVEPERCRHCGQPFPGTATGRRGRAWRRLSGCLRCGTCDQDGRRPHRH